MKFLSVGFLFIYMWSSVVCLAFVPDSAGMKYLSITYTAGSGRAREFNIRVHTGATRDKNHRFKGAHMVKIC
jgi:hypothetical protein